jgi:hypothetical protein
MRLNREKDLALQVAQYMQLQHREVMYRFDLAADLKLTMGQARRHKALHPNRGYPDFQILEPRGRYSGLFIELKREGVKTHKRNGELLSDPHLKEQEATLNALKERGYSAHFCRGFDEARTCIDEYLGLKK